MGLLSRKALRVESAAQLRNKEARLVYRLSQPPLQVRAARPQVFSARSSLHPFAFLAATQLEYLSSQPCLQAVLRLVEVTLRLFCAASKACERGAENDAAVVIISNEEKSIPRVSRLLIIRSPFTSQVTRQSAVCDCLVLP